MSQVARLYGNSPALLYVGLRLLDMGYEVTLMKGPSESSGAPLRPLRLRTPVVALLKEAFRRQTRPYFFLEEAPLLSSWAEVGKDTMTGIFDRTSHVDRWVSSAQLSFELGELFAQLGGRTEAFPLTPLPSGRGVALEIMDLDPKQLTVESVSAYFPHLERRPSLRASEVWLPNVDASNDEPNFEFTRFEATLAISETHPTQGKIFSLYSSSEYSLQRALRALKDPRGVAPTAWKAQVLSERGPQERSSVMRWGYAGFYRPGVWALGASIGKLNPALNLEASDSILQAARFIETLKGVPRGQSLILATEDWRRQEKSRFLSGYKRARFMERFFFSDGSFVDAFQKTSSFLPQRLRQLLKAPI
ncbi:MAG: hypothetical protein ABIR96_08265 [Bdellovibrionota bacterium]